MGAGDKVFAALGKYLGILAGSFCNGLIQGAAIVLVLYLFDARITIQF